MNKFAVNSIASFHLIRSAGGALLVATGEVMKIFVQSAEVCSVIS